MFAIILIVCLGFIVLSTVFWKYNRGYMTEIDESKKCPENQVEGMCNIEYPICDNSCQRARWEVCIAQRRMGLPQKDC